MKGDLLRAHLECAVQLRVRRFVQAGGPTDFDRQAVRGFAQDICTYGDDLLFGGAQCAETMDKLAEALAVLSFQPSGVTAFGLRFESSGAECVITTHQPPYEAPRCCSAVVCRCEEGATRGDAGGAITCP